MRGSIHTLMCCCSYNVRNNYYYTHGHVVLYVYIFIGRFYEAEICAILLLLRCPFRRNHFLPKSFSRQKPWTIVRCFYRNRGHFLWSFYSRLECGTKLKFVPFCSPWDKLSHGTFFFLSEVKIFSFWPKTMDYSQWFWPKLNYTCTTCTR